MDTDRVFKYYLDTKKNWVIISVVVVGLITLLICLTVAGTSTPNMIKSQSLFLEKCASNSTVSCFASQDSLSLQFIIDNIQKKNHFLYYEFYGYFYYKELKQAMRFNLTSTNNSKNYKNLKYEEKIYTLKSSEPVGIFYIPYTTYETYKLELTLNTTNSNLLALEIRVSYMEIDYFNFLIKAKYFFMALTIVNLVYFFFNVRSIKLRHWQFETKLNFIMCISLLFYNEPLIGAYTEFFGIGYTVVSVFCNSQFLCALILYYIFLLQKISIFSKNKIVYMIEGLAVAGLFGFYFTLYLFLEGNLTFNKKFHYHHIGGLYLKLFKALIAFIVFVGVVLVIYMCLGVKKWILREIKYIIYWATNYCIIVLTFVFVGMGYFRLMTGGEVVLSVLALFNIFFYIMLWMATPDKTWYLNEVNMSSEPIPSDSIDLNEQNMGSETRREPHVYNFKELDNKI